MATTGSNRSRKSNTGRKKTSTGSRRNSTRTNAARYEEPLDNSLINEILLIIVFAICVLLFLCNFGVIGTFGDLLSNIQFGIFGFWAYLAPLFIFIGIAFATINAGSPAATRKLIAALVLFVLLQMIAELICGRIYQMESFELLGFYTDAASNHNGGGIFAGALTYFSYHYLSMLGTILLVVVLALIAVVVLTEKSVLSSARRGGEQIVQARRDDAVRRKEEYQNRMNAKQMELADYDQEEALPRRESAAQRKARIAEEKRLQREERENEKILRMDKKARGVMVDTALTNPEEDRKTRDDIHEITLNEMEQSREEMSELILEPVLSPIDAIPEPITELTYKEPEISAESVSRLNQVEKPNVKAATEKISDDKVENTPQVHNTPQVNNTPQVHNSLKPAKKYMFPPVSLLQKGNNSGKGDQNRNLKETALRLQQTLQTFGVKVTITDISQGPAVTRYELQPEQGVKVSKIVGLADDIKLNLAATDIRIEAPIPGKAAVGIEVPNKENYMVAFRDLIESQEYKEFNSKLSFAVGKDIGGKVVVTDIAKMPHMLIAGATGSGKSVCINTIIMSILYKAHPDEVKLIMIDPKVVELSVYNGIPHLLIPVVTDPKKAAGALHWGVAEMTDRYNKFAEFNVRDLKGYNQKARQMSNEGKADAPSILPQIVIIVDELADLMMVAPGEVEESICRLAQLARAAGIHLIIATQRPSVDVITGLIKANMPSRVAFAVSSGVDSRTILDMNGAEKLLGKGDMLFYPQGYPKPARIQGAFVSDKEVQDVVDYLKDQNVISNYNPNIEEKMKVVQSAGGNTTADSSSLVDDYFVEAGKFIIDKDKASIGMLQRVFKIGFNRAARIMDQLCEAGVVGEEEGTKPRKVLMSLEQFESYIEESL